MTGLAALFCLAVSARAASTEFIDTHAHLEHMGGVGQFAAAREAALDNLRALVDQLPPDLARRMALENAGRLYRLP